MELKLLDAQEYEKICSVGQYFYNCKNFIELNKEKVDEINYVLFSEKKRKLLLPIGIKNQVFMMPFSAPFSMFEQLQDNIRIEEFEVSLRLLEEYARTKKIKKIYFRLPPSFYDETSISKLQNCMLRCGYQIVSVDLNYQFYLKSEEEYNSSLHRNARKNLKRALDSELVFKQCKTEEEKVDAYHIIQNNRMRKGYPLKMKYDDVKNTIQYTEHDFFVIEKDGIGIASAIIFKVNKECYQVIYWGDVAGYEEVRPMNYLAYMLYRFYAKKGIKVLDIGPSTEDGVPNYGLCDFKESIGCSVSTKYTFEKKII